MKIGILYYSETGNTEKIAKAIYNELKGKAELFNISQSIPEISEDYDILFIGTPTHGDNLPENLRDPEKWEILAGKKVNLFYTHTAPKKSYSPITYLKNIQTLFNTLNIEIIDNWNCRGENKREDIIEWLRINTPEKYEQAITAIGLPNQKSFDSAGKWADKIANSFITTKED